MTRVQCLYCEAESRYWFKWRGYYKFRCENGHWFGLATPSKAAANWARLSKKAAEEYVRGIERFPRG